MTAESVSLAFWFSDLESSTMLWEEHPEAMKPALAQHDAILDAAVRRADGTVVKTTGDGLMAVFDRAENAVSAALEAQQALASAEWPETGPLRVRIGIHVGSAQPRGGDFYGPSVNRAARIMGAGHGGQVLLSAAVVALVEDALPATAGVLDLGQHRLKDLSRPEHLFQLTGDGLEASFPPLATLNAINHNLPEQLTQLIGRDEELAEIDRLLDQTRLLTLLAPGGTGKTHLAVQAAASQTSNYPDGVFLISLADLTVGDDIVQDIAAALGVALASEAEAKGQLLEYLKPREILLLFDNFEHLLDSAGLVTEILEAAPSVRVIVTSRTRLNLAAETTMTLAGLDTSFDTPETALETSGVELFLDAAQRVRPGMSLVAGDFEPMARVLELTAGMPLAILLAASWTNMLSVADIADEIQKSLDFLESTGGGESDRHRSIRAVFDYTWELLTEEEKDVFAALSVFRGGFTRGAAEAVTGASLRDLATLTAKSLISPDPEAGRYAVHELLRQYAQAELERNPDQDLSVRQAHAEHYAQLCADLHHNGMEDQQATFATMETDFDNIRLGWRHSAAERQAKAIHEMMGALWYLIESRGWYLAALDLYDAAVVAFEPSDDEATIARAGSVAGRSACWAILGQDPEAAAKAAADAVEELRGLADPPTFLVALNQLTVCLFSLRRVDESVALLDEGLAIAEGGDLSVWPSIGFLRAGWKNARSFMALMAGDHELARDLLDESGEFLDSIGESFVLSWNTAQKAQLALAEDRPDDAIMLLWRSVENSRKIDFSRGLEFASSILADTQLARGDYAKAELALVEGLAAAEKTGMVPEMLRGLRKMAAVFAATDRDAQAVELLSTVLAEPTSHIQQWAEESPTDELARAALEDVEQGLDPEEFERAIATGATTPYAVAVKRLTDTLDT